MTNKNPDLGSAAGWSTSNATNFHRLYYSIIVSYMLVFYIPAVLGGVIFVCIGGDAARGGVVVWEVGSGRDEAELKTPAKGGGVKVSPDPRAASLWAGCDSCCVLTGVRSGGLDSVVALETDGVDTCVETAPKLSFVSPGPKTKGPVEKGELKLVVKGFVVVVLLGLLVFGGD